MLELGAGGQRLVVHGHVAAPKARQSTGLLELAQLPLVLLANVLCRSLVVR